MAVVDWVIVAAYLAFAMAVGLFFARRAGKSTSEFFISGRNLPWWLAGTSMVATSFAADTPLVVSGWVRDEGISFNWLWWSFAIGGMFSVFLLSRLWRRAEVVTDVELSELRYGGRPAAVLRAARGAYMAIPVNCITLAWVILAMAKLMNVLLDIDPGLSVAICLVLTVAYAVLSGFWGVVVTDLLQFVLAMAGAIGLCVVTVSRLGGLAALRAKAEAASPMGERLTHFSPGRRPGPGPSRRSSGPRPSSPSRCSSSCSGGQTRTPTAAESSCSACPPQRTKGIRCWRHCGSTSLTTPSAHGRGYSWRSDRSCSSPKSRARMRILA